jgi:tRNA(Ile)-lysidine synthase
MFWEYFLDVGSGSIGVMTNPPVFVVAVSGGIDSVCLLHMLVHQSPQIRTKFMPDTQYIVAHANHGIRGQQADRDEEFVRKIADSYQLIFESKRLDLGPDASEETARTARYAFLEATQKKYHASGILLAHHQGDVIETAIINVLRGTGRRGLSSLKSTHERLRPLLEHTKQELRDYATTHNLTWVEDSSNADPKYLRNKVRQALSGKTEIEHTASLAKLEDLSTKNDLLDKEIATILQYKLKNNAIISRSWFIMLPHVVASELIHALLAKINTRNIDRGLVERIVVAIKVARPGTKIDIDGTTIGMATKRSFRIVDRQTFSARRL